MRNLIVGFILGSAASIFAAGLDFEVINKTVLRFQRDIVLVEGDTIECSWPNFSFSQTVPANKTANVTMTIVGELE